MSDPFFNSNVCMRCHKPSDIFTMSRFNTDRICLDCQKKEKAHKDYQKAVEAEAEQVRRGNYNFIGIGKPADL